MDKLERILRELFQEKKDFGECFDLYVETMGVCEKVHLERCDEIRKEQN